MSALLPCPSCARHVRRSETSCPFCACTLSLAHAPPRPMPTERLGRAALMAFTTLVASGSVGCTQTHETDGGLDAHVEAFDAYRGSDSATYGGAVDIGPPPDVGRDAGPTDAASAECPDTNFVGMYGSPPPCGDS